MNYLPFEMHCHTKHSDGRFTVPELMHDAAAYGYRGIALTDHNAVSGAADVTPELERQYVTVIRGIEWTTFYGHLLVLGCRNFVDWRFVTPDTIDGALADIRKAGGVAGIAHPFEMGEPLLCGCHWEFHVTRWDLLDYIEIWSEDSPLKHTKNILVKPWYDGLLNKGYHLAVSAGRDWHGPDRAGHIPLLSATYLGMEGELTEQSAIAAVRSGRTYVTLGPTVALTCAGGGKTCSIGGTLPPGRTEVTVEVREEERKEILSANGIRTKKIRLIRNGETAGEKTWDGKPAVFSETLGCGWIRAEIYGDTVQERDTILALTSPVYIGRD